MVYSGDSIQDTDGGVLRPISSVHRNRIINGSFTIDQRNAGASVNQGTSNTYNLDRWASFGSQNAKFTIQQNAGSVTPPVGFSNYLGCTSTAATSVGASDFFNINQIIEGLNVADLGWGTANAKTITISFWVRSSLTGTFGGSLRNSALNRAYPYTYTISSANTWEQKSVTIAGDTTGTWLTNNGAGIQLIFSLGMGSTFSGTAGAWAAGNFASATGATSVVGTNGATFYITGVQLEVGTQATSFEYRQYQQELALCQRYYYKVSGGIFGYGYCATTTTGRFNVQFPTTLRTAPTALEQTGTAADYNARRAAASANLSAVPSFNKANTNSSSVNITVASGFTAGAGVELRPTSSESVYLAWSAEL
jgi:hypothetical protein